MDRTRILLVEDETLIRIIIAESLCDAGFEVIQAGSGDEAIGLLDRLDRVDLLLTDMQMPGQADGNAVAAHARWLCPGLPVIYATGRPETLADPAGSNNAVIRKPFGPTEMLAIVEALLRGTATPGLETGASEAGAGANGRRTVLQIGH